ncbi:unnamed protein product, partial [marine sediment metagenome]
MISMNMIAKKLKLSRCTISNILNENTKYKYKKETIDLVKKTAENMGYISNKVAQSLKTGRSGTIAFILPDIGHPFFIEIAKIITQLSFSLGYSLIICASE